MQPTFQFGEYTVRPVGERDIAYIDKLISADPYHAEVWKPEWFMFKGPGEDAWAIEDGQGTVVLYFKTRTAMQLFVQFGEQEPSANRDALRKGMAWLEGMLFQNQVREVIFDTEGPLLMALAKRRLGFTETAPGTLYKTLPSPATMRAVEGHWHHQPTTSEEAG